VAVLYFDNNTGDHGLDWLRKTIPDILIAALAQSKYVRVITPDRLLDLAADMGVDTERGLERQTAVAIARRANVQAMITGSVIRAGAQFRILAQIQDSHGSLIKTEQIEGSGTDSLLGLADELSSRIKVSMEISAHGVPSAAEGISQTRTTSLEAYNYYVSGRDKLHKRRYADAISDLRKAIQSDAGFAVAYELLANAYYILGEQSLAEETSQKAVQFSTKLPRTEQLRILRRNAQVRGDLDAELTFLHELEALQPDEAEWHFLLGWHYSTHKRAYEKSVFQYKRAIGIDPEGEPRYHAYLTTTYLMAGNRGEALAACRKYVSLLPNDAISHSRLGKVHILTGDYDAALHEFNKARELQPDFFDTSSGLGDLYCAKGMYQEALKYYRNSVAQAISKNQERDGHVLLAAAYLDVNEVNRASEESKRALELASKDLKTHWIAGLIAMRKGELHAAEAAADKMRDLLRKSHSSYQAEYLHDLKAKISLARQDFEGAIGECVQANALGPEDHAYFRHALADAYFHKRELGGAIQELENALRFNPSYAPAHYMLGRIHEQEGKRTEALAEYQLCLRILKNADPGFPLIGGLKEGVARLARRM
jgi:tetratricopeptide (TPR) repeat protein